MGKVSFIPKIIFFFLVHVSIWFVIYYINIHRLGEWVFQSQQKTY